MSNLIVNTPLSKAEEVYHKLMNEFGFKDATGKICFTLKDISIVVNQPNVVGNILEEWLAKWMKENGITHIHNEGQSSPDFWLNLEKDSDDWLEVKSFTRSPNFDIAAYNSFINLILQKPYKLQSSYLLIKSYKDYYGVELHIPRWMDIKDKYDRRPKPQKTTKKTKVY